MKGNKGFFLAKIDLEKAFDRIEWSFVKFTLHYFNFPNKIINIIMSCISSSKTAILINGTRTKFFNLTRGLRQGDPMSPYIFILYMEVLSHQIELSVNTRDWLPLKICRHGPSLSHLFFVDDLILMSQATKESSNAIKGILENFCSWSGQKINNQKSKILFSNNFNINSKADISSLLNISLGNSFDRYLGFPIFNGKIRNNDFKEIMGNLQSKLSGWKMKFLNIAGRTTLVKSSLSHMATHLMNYIKLPSYVTNHLDKLQRNFIWGTTDVKRKLHMISWDVITKGKDLGGLGI